MDFKLTQQQRELQETARNFAQKEMVEVDNLWNKPANLFQKNG